MQRTASGLSVMHHAVAAAQIEKPVAPVLKFLSLSYRIHIISLAKICSFGISAFHGVYSKYSLSEVMRQLSIKDMFQGTPRRSCRDALTCGAPSSSRGCDPPCLSMRNNAPVEHCAAEAFILHREIVLTMKVSITLRAYLMSEDTRKSAMKNKKCCLAALFKASGSTADPSAHSVSVRQHFFMQLIEEAALTFFTPTISQAALVFHSDHVTGCSDFFCSLPHRQLL